MLVLTFDALMFALWCCLSDIYVLRKEFLQLYLLKIQVDIGTCAGMRVSRLYKVMSQ